MLGIKEGTTAPLQNAVIENARALPSDPLVSYREAEASVDAFETAEIARAHQATFYDQYIDESSIGLDHEDPFTKRLVSFWEYLDEVYWEQDWNLSKVLKAFHAVPALDWVYGMGYSSLDERGKLRIRALHLLGTFSELDDDDRNNWELRIFFTEEAREILKDPLFPQAFSIDENDRVKEIEEIAAKSSHLAAA